MSLSKNIGVLARSLTARLLLPALCAAVLSAHASSPATSDPARPAALSPGNNFLFAVYPAVGKVGQARKLFLTYSISICFGDVFTLDTSLMQTSNLVVLRTQRTPQVCPTTVNRVARVDLEFTPATAGSLTIRWDLGGPDLTIQTVAATPPSKFDVNGMWFDAATNGSGISLHHRQTTTDAAFGTWFLFSNSGESRWYTLQSASWQQDGSVLEGLLIGVDGACPKDNLIACPARGSIPQSPSAVSTLAVVPALARITFQSATRGRAEVLSLDGKLLFTSELTKLSF